MFDSFERVVVGVDVFDEVAFLNNALSNVYIVRVIVDDEYRFYHDELGIGNLNQWNVKGPRGSLIRRFKCNGTVHHINIFFNEMESEA